MYACFAIIYGVPISLKVSQWFNENEIEPEKFGFKTLYSGSANHQPGYLGIHLTDSDECKDADRIDIENGLFYTGNMTIDKAKSYSIIPTEKDKIKVKQKVDKLPDELKNLLPPISIYLVHYTS